MRPQHRPSIAAHGQGTASARPKLPSQIVNFSFFKVDPAWRRFSQEEQQQGKEEFAAVVKEFESRTGVSLLPYSLVGIRADAELLLWRIANEIEVFQEMTTKLMRTGLGKYLTITYSYLSMTKRSVYVDKLDPQHQNPRTHIFLGRHKYLFILSFYQNT